MASTAVLLAALRDFRRSALALARVVADHEDTASIDLEENYPFDRSIDETVADIAQWVEWVEVHHTL